MQKISNNKLTLLRKLNQKKYRTQEQLFLVEGVRAVEQIIKNGEIEIRELFFDESQYYGQQDKWDKAAKSMSCSTITEDLFAEVSDTDHPQGVLALCRMPEETNVNQLAQTSG